MFIVRSIAEVNFIERHKGEHGRHRTEYEVSVPDILLLELNNSNYNNSIYIRATFIMISLKVQPLKLQAVAHQQTLQSFFTRDTCLVNEEKKENSLVEEVLTSSLSVDPTST